MGAKEKAAALHERGFNCAQSVLGALGEYTKQDENTALAVSCGFGGGVSCGEICGAASGAVMALGLVFSQKNPQDASVRAQVRKLSSDFNRQFRENERMLRLTMRNDELIKMLGFEKSLVYFSTSLKSTEATLSKIGYGRILRLYEEDRELLDDVSIEMSQAIEMCSLYTNVLNGTMDTFGNIINNNMNITMRTLAILTLVLSIPNMVYGFYGMNTPLPLDGTWMFAFSLSVVATVGATIILMRSRFMK